MHGDKHEHLQVLGKTTIGSASPAHAEITFSLHCFRGEQTGLSVYMIPETKSCLPSQLALRIYSCPSASTLAEPTNLATRIQAR